MEDRIILFKLFLIKRNIYENILKHLNMYMLIAILKTSY
jgi:hypothetical protein